METAYDVIVIGSGLSGLISAALLANNGLRVTVICDGERSSTYEKKGYVFNDRSLPITGLESGPLGSVFAEIGLPKQVFRRDGIPFQVVLPDERINVYEEKEIFRDELRRCFPRDFDRVSSFYNHMADLYASITPVMETDPFSFRLFLPKGVRKGSRPVSDAISRTSQNQMFKAFIGAQLSSFSNLSAPFSSIAASSILESSKNGIYYLQGGGDGLNAILMKKIRALGGSITQAEVKDIARNGNRWLVRTKDEAFSGRTVIGAIDAVNFRNLFLDGRKKYLKNAERIEKSFYLLTVNLGIKEAGIPAGMAENVLMLRDYKREYSSDNLLFLQMGPSANEKRSISVTCKVPKDDYSRKERLREITERMLEGVQDLCPFIDRHLEVLDINLPDTLEDGLYSTSLKQRMGVGVLPHEIVRGEILFAGPEVFPSLGFDGLVYSGRMTANAVLKGLEKGKA